jgi:hypothetical protein
MAKWNYLFEADKNTRKLKRIDTPEGIFKWAKSKLRSRPNLGSLKQPQWVALIKGATDAGHHVYIVNTYNYGSEFRPTIHVTNLRGDTGFKPATFMYARVVDLNDPYNLSTQLNWVNQDALNITHINTQASRYYKTGSDAPITARIILSRVPYERIKSVRQLIRALGLRKDLIDNEPTS